ncbi:MAG TPA: RluA family pseudouridine synthase [Bdellovibrionales bacterium]|nr:MAG: hypothetical protein A2Z97_03475 [Bdellovibrionales bacterium GWB1_52_6]OFZ04043.1 MAG: hypothetical protein A2X97_14670 [Bdellovibrionales bacterium GWA1_52_35]OFZ35246.1 MAG: hypothetical protein A2070_04990 [Bdellovibrionales bacterium GWC1_52_8]HAR42229.1 RluA family pseudouridine synthase [Bdellovibrionales bacterium]HCM39872.1 RluA family pseudouridine synthase [Bdellovibrionales bacterium]
MAGSQKSSSTLSEDQYLVTHYVAETGLRLDAFLKTRYRKRSREVLKRAIDDGHIFLRREQSPHLQIGRLKASTQLIQGDEVQVLSERRPEPEVSFDYTTIFEDEVLLVLDKPANLPVHPAGRYFFNTLLVHLRTHGHKDPLKAEREYYLAHRIDKETSGVLVLTRDRDVCAHLVKQFSDRTTSKHYLAIVHGTPPEEFEIKAALKRTTNSQIELKMMVASEEDGGAPSFTSFKRIETRGKYSLVECFPKTGRQHQIRVHLEAAGHPIVGDKLYGMPEEEALRYFERKHLTPEAQARLILPRHALHAAGIRIQHPLTLQQLEFKAPLPADLRKFLDLQE